MAIPTSYFSDDLDAMIADLPVVATFGATTFQGSVTPLAQEETLMLAGNLSVKMVRLVFNQGSITPSASFKPQGLISLGFPTPSTLVPYEIVSIDYSPDNVSYEVVLKASNRA